MREGNGFSNFPKTTECNSHKIQGVTVEYVPNRGFTGPDEVEFDVISQIGYEALATYSITVKAWDSSDAPNFRIQGDLSPSEAAPASGEHETADGLVQGAGAPAAPSESPASLPTAPTPPGGAADAIPTQEYVPILPGGARAAMLIASPDNPQNPVVNLGSTVWSTIPPAPGQPATVAVKADADIPDLKMHASMTLRKNTDPTLQATHTIDLKFSFADGAPIAGFKDVGAPQMRKLDSTASEALTSVEVKVSDVYFLIALAKGDQDTARNLDLMQTRTWFDFPLLLNDNRIAKLVFQKSTEGEAMLERAFDAWDGGTRAIEQSSHPAESASDIAPASAVGDGLVPGELPQYKFAHAATESPIVGGNADTRYFTIVYGMIRSHLRAPSGPSAAPSSRGGAIVFSVDESGHLVQRKLVSPSGSPSLDTAVMTAIAEAAPYPAPPNWQPRAMRLTYGK